MQVKNILSRLIAFIFVFLLLLVASLSVVKQVSAQACGGILLENYLCGSGNYTVRVTGNQNCSCDSQNGYSEIRVDGNAHRCDRVIGSNLLYDNIYFSEGQHSVTAYCMYASELNQCKTGNLEVSSCQPEPVCGITADAQCINDNSQVEVTWTNTSDPNLVFDRYVVRGADTTQAWPANGVFRDISDINSTSTIINVGPNAGEVDEGVSFEYTVSINNGNIPDYLGARRLCVDSAGTITCAPVLTPTPTSTPYPLPGCGPGDNCCRCISEIDPVDGILKCEELADFCDESQQLTAECTTDLNRCEETNAESCNCVFDPLIICGNKGEPCCQPGNTCLGGYGFLQCNSGICTLPQIAALDAFCIGGDGPVADSSESTIYTAIGCIPTRNTQQFVVFYLRWGMGMAGGISLILIVTSGFMIITAQGDPRKMKAAKELLASAITGMALFIFSAYLMRLIGSDILKIPGL